MILIAVGVEAYKADMLKAKEIEGLSPFDFQSFDSFDESCLDFIQSSSFFGGKKVALLRIKKLDELDCKLFTDNQEFLLNSVNELFVYAESSDKRKKFVKSLESLKVIRDVNRCEDTNSLLRIIRYEVKKNGGLITPAAESIFIERVKYLEDESINLYHIKNMILDLLDESENIDEDIVKRVVRENVIYNAFSIISLIRTGNLGDVKKQALLVSESGRQIECISAMLYDFRTAYKISLGFSKSEVNCRKSIDLSSKELLLCMNVCTDTIDKIKSGNLKEDDAIMYCSLNLFKILKEVPENG